MKPRAENRTHRDPLHAAASCSGDNLCVAFQSQYMTAVAAARLDLQDMNSAALADRNRGRSGSSAGCISALQVDASQLSESGSSFVTITQFNVSQPRS